MEAAARNQSGSSMNSKKETRKLSQIVGRAFVITAILTLLISVTLSACVVIQKEYDDARDLLIQDVEDINAQLNDDMRDYLIDSSVLMWNDLKSMLENASGASDEITAYLKKDDDIIRFSEANVVDEHGIIIYSSEPANVGYHMASAEGTAAFLSLLDQEDRMSREDVPSPKDGSQPMMYGAVQIDDHHGFIMAGFDQEDLRDAFADKCKDFVQHKHVGQDGSLLVCDEDFTVCASTDDKFNGVSFADLATINGRNVADMESGSFSLTAQDGTYDLTYIVSKYGQHIIGLYPVEEAFRGVGAALSVLLAIEVIVFPGVFLLVYIFLKRRVIKGVVSLNDSLQAIADGDIDEKADVRTSLEFESLSDNINTTVARIRAMAEKEAKMLEDELTYARVIQRAALPAYFPAFPDRKEFGIYASMDAAEMVGGDFYDFFMLSPNELLFLIADVSGDGIPAALFMMSAKSALKTLTETGYSVAEVFTRANRELAGEGERVDMFVTAWMGVLDLATGNLRYVNAGHNPPLVIHEGKASYVAQETDMALCAFDGFSYRQQELTLCPGDRILLYTDGVTEAKNAQRKNYGVERLQNLLSKPISDTDIKESCRITCEAVFEDVAVYAKKKHQPDDVTVLCVSYAGESGEEK